MTSPLFIPEWCTRSKPLEAVSLAAVGDAARRLALRLLDYEDDALGRWEGVAGDGLLLLLGEREHLPWVDGAIYLGRDPAAPTLLLPTTLLPSTPLPLLERALRTRYPLLAPPLAVLPSCSIVAPLGAARAIDRGRLQAWLDGPS